MLKGTNRSVIVVKGNGRSRFETVYFIIKKGCSHSRRELADEAQKIIGESGYVCSLKNGTKPAKINFFIAGIILGALVASSAWFIVILLR